MNNFPYFRPVNKLLPAIAAFLLAGGLILDSIQSGGYEASVQQLI